MPELPDVDLYVTRIAERVVGRPLTGVRLASPFLLRTAVPPLASVFGAKVLGVSRLGKRIVLAMERDRFLVVHLMIAGRFRWYDEARAKIPGKLGLAAFDFPGATLILTEASTKKRASLHLVVGADALRDMDPGGLEPIGSSLADFDARLRLENRTVKRALTDPTLFSGIGNAYSDEILFFARMSPTLRTQSLSPDRVARLHEVTIDTLASSRERLLREIPGFPEKVTAFRPEFAVHGKYGQLCPACGTKVQRIRYADNESNYCPTCQTEGKLLADRSLSRLLRGDWPRTLDELELRRKGATVIAPGSRLRSRSRS
jgi:formamidopyrimidine-DNA glycosylase